MKIIILLFLFMKNKSPCMRFYNHITSTADCELKFIFLGNSYTLMNERT